MERKRNISPFFKTDAVSHGSFLSSPTNMPKINYDQIKKLFLGNLSRITALLPPWAALCTLRPFENLLNVASAFSFISTEKGNITLDLFILKGMYVDFNSTVNCESMSTPLSAPLRALYGWAALQTPCKMDFNSVS